MMSGSKVVIVVMVICYITSTSALLGLNEEREDLLRTVDCNKNCQYRSEVPVCGTNGQTYDSMCDLERDHCKKANVDLLHSGECTLAEKCMIRRNHQLGQLSSGKLVFVPTCLPDGSYAPVQCHNFTMFCWCSTVNGDIITETVTKDEMPQCLGNLTSAPPLDPPQQDRCRGKKRNQFTDNMVEVIMEDYILQASGQRGSGSLNSAIRWKWRQLDKDGDGFLKRREYKHFRNLVRKFVEPKKCSKFFPRVCDANMDKKLSRDEWKMCFTRKQRNGRPRNNEKKCKKGRTCVKETEKKRPKPSCKREREMLMQDANMENNSIPILDCQSNGNYKPIQCHKVIHSPHRDSAVSAPQAVHSYCFCVDEFTGNSLEGTTVTNGTPDCSKPFPHARDWPGCSGKNKTKFMQDLKKYLLNKVDNNGSSIPTADATSQQSVEEFAAKYHFSHLDKNGNGFLERRERKELKKFLKRNPKLRVCGKKLAKYCDVDSDQRVSQEEWVACVILPTQNGTRNGDDKRPHPFEEILKPET